MADPDYVDRGSWLRIAGRADAIDEVADEFERRDAAPAPHSSAAAARTAAASRWPSRSRGWRSADLLHPRPAPHPTS